MRPAHFATILAVMTLGLMSCASGPKYAAIAARIPHVPADHGRIYFYRLTIVGAAVTPKVRLNDQVVGKAIAQGFFFVDQAPGDCVVACSTEAEHHLSFTLEDQQVRYVKLKMKMGFFVGHVLPELVDKETGEAEVTKAKYIGEESALLPEGPPSV